MNNAVLLPPFVNFDSNEAKSKTQGEVHGQGRCAVAPGLAGHFTRLPSTDTFINNDLHPRTSRSSTS